MSEPDVYDVLSPTIEGDSIPLLARDTRADCYDHQSYPSESRTTCRTRSGRCRRSKTCR